MPLDEGTVGAGVGGVGKVTVNFFIFYTKQQGCQVSIISSPEERGTIIQGLVESFGFKTDAKQVLVVVSSCVMMA